MPKSKRRKVNGRPVRMTTTTPRALIAQRHVGMLCDDLDDLLRAVPTSYNPTDIQEVLEHHYRTTAVVDWLREHKITDVLAAMAGGDMAVVDDTNGGGTPTVEADIVQPPTDPGASLDSDAPMSYADMIAAQLPTTGGQLVGEVDPQPFGVVRTVEIREPGQALTAAITDSVGDRVKVTLPSEVARDDWAADTATLEQVAAGLRRSKFADDMAALERSARDASTVAAVADILGKRFRGPCQACGRDISYSRYGVPTRHKQDPRGTVWCVR